MTYSYKNGSRRIYIGTFRIGDYKGRAGLVAHQLRMLAAFPEFLSSIPSIHMVAHDHLSIKESIKRGFDPLLRHVGVHTDRALSYILKKT